MRLRQKLLKLNQTLTKQKFTPCTLALTQVGAFVFMISYLEKV